MQAEIQTVGAPRTRQAPHAAPLPQLVTLPLALRLARSLNASFPYTPNAYLDGMTEHELGLHHVEHCFEYLRQGIMCAVDTHLEDTRVLEG